MRHMKHALYITYSNQKARDLKKEGLLQPFDTAVSLSRLILDTYEQHHFETIVDDMLGASIIHHIIRAEKVAYFDYLQSGDESLFTIFDFILKCRRNGIAFDALLGGEKLKAMQAIDRAYQEFKKKHYLADLADVERCVLEEWSSSALQEYSEVYVDDFTVGEIDFVDSKWQAELLEKLAGLPRIENKAKNDNQAVLIKPEQEVFDAVDEVRTALKIIRKLLENGEDVDDILVVASGIGEYAPLYKLFLDEYGLKGYSSAGTPLSAFHHHGDPKAAQVFRQYKQQLASAKALYGKLGLKMDSSAEERLKASMKLADEPVGIELTEPNQLVGLDRSYGHIIFIGTDINHFPPQAQDNFLYTYEQELEYFCANDYYKSSKTHFDELRRIAENLYIITAGYSDKRELVPSILIPKQIDKTIDLGGIKSVNELALENRAVMTDDEMRAYCESISSEALSRFDGMDVKGVVVDHLSASQINKYLSCPLSYLFNNKMRLKAPDQPEEGFDVMQKGSLMHLCYELFGRKIRDENMRSVDRDELYRLMLDISAEAYNHEDTKKNRPNGENIHHRIFLGELQAGLQDDREAGMLAKFVDYYIDNAAGLNYFQNTEFEKEFCLDGELKPYEKKDKGGRNYFINGFIDRFDNLDDKANIIDYKSKKVDSKRGKDKKTQEKIDELKDVQLALYMLYAKQQYPDKKAYHAAMLSFKGSSRAAFFGELTEEEFDEAYEKKLKGIVFDTKANIESGNFGFDNSDEEICKWCDYKRICHQDVLEKVQ